MFSLNDGIKTVWFHIPTLNFDFNSFLDRGKIKNALDNGIQFDVKGHLQSKGTSFKRFILEVLSQHSSNSITKLSYSFPSRIEEDFVTKVLCYEQCRWVQEFYIATYNADEPSWASLSACTLLIVLKITCRHVDNLGSLVLPCLRILEIKRVFDFMYWNDYFLPYNCMQSYNNYYGDIGLNENTFSGCPNLECLVLFDCILYAACICAPKLEKLELMALFHAFTFPEFELCTPNLKSVKFSNVIPCELKCCSDIVNIHQVSIAFDYCDFGRELCLLQQRVVKNICELLKVFHDVVSLILPPNTTQVFNLFHLYYFLFNFIPFHILFNL